MIFIANWRVTCEECFRASAVAARQGRLSAVARMRAGLLSLRPDAIGTPSQRRAHDDAPKGFIYIVPAAIEGGSPRLFFKLSDGNAHWSVGHHLKAKVSRRAILHMDIGAAWLVAKEHK